jgi:Flp pilus assembly protein protease CpaA
MGSWWLTGLFAVWAFTVAVHDVTQRRVPNSLLMLLAVPALLAVTINRHGLLGAGIRESLAGLFVGGAPLLAGYLIRQVGAGDVKLSGLQGFILGIGGIGKALLISGVVLGIMSLFALLRRNEQAPHLRLPAGVALVVGFIAVALDGHPI